MSQAFMRYLRWKREEQHLRFQGNGGQVKLAGQAAGAGHEVERIGGKDGERVADNEVSERDFG